MSWLPFMLISIRVLKKNFLCKEVKFKWSIVLMAVVIYTEQPCSSRTPHGIGLENKGTNKVNNET